MTIPSASFQNLFNGWLDEALAEPIPEGVIAYCFNLAEPWCIELVGSDRYSKDDPDWACEETFGAEASDLDLPAAEVGTRWEAVLEAAKLLVERYINRPSAGATRLRGSAAVAVGFVDGDLHRVWPRE
jgi:hypothetical protein